MFFFCCILNFLYFIRIFIFTRKLRTTNKNLVMEMQMQMEKMFLINCFNKKFIVKFPTSLPEFVSFLVGQKLNGKKRSQTQTDWGSGSKLLNEPLITLNTYTYFPVFLPSAPAVHLKFCNIQLPKTTVRKSNSKKKLKS